MTAPAPRQIVTPGAPPKPDADGVVTFGRRSHPIGAPPKRFRIEVEGPREPGGPVERWDEEFRAYVELDGGAVLQLMNARDQGEQARRTAGLLVTSVVDDDGVPSDYVPSPAVIDDLPPGAQLPYEDGEGRTIIADAEGGLWRLPEGVELSTEEGAQLPEEAEQLFRSWRGGVETDAEVLWDEMRDGSSKRRLLYVMSSDTLRTSFEFLEQIANWLIGDATARPTARPARSAPGPRRT